MIYRKVYSVFFKNEKYLSKTLLTRLIPPTFRLCPADLACLAWVSLSAVIFIMVLGSGSCDPYHFFVGSGRSILWSRCYLWGASTWLEAPALAAETSLFPEEEFSFAVAFEPEELLPFDLLVCACVPLSSLSPGL